MNRDDDLPIWWVKADRVLHRLSRYLIRFAVAYLLARVAVLIIGGVS